MIESGMDPAPGIQHALPKSSGSSPARTTPSCGRRHVRLLDYEVELGLVLARRSRPGTVTERTSPSTSARSSSPTTSVARDVQLPQGQLYKGKSYPTFCPVGPYLCVPEPDELARWRELRLTLSVNGELRQDGLAGDMIFGPAATLTELSRLERLDVGDLLLTGTPGGVALQPPRPLVQRDRRRCCPTAARGSCSSRARPAAAPMSPGDRIEASIRTADGALDLGTQHNRRAVTP